MKFLQDIDPQARVPVNWMAESKAIREVQPLYVMWCKYNDDRETDTWLDIGGEIVSATTVHECDPANLMALPSMKMTVKWKDKKSFETDCALLNKVDYIRFNGALVSRFYVTEKHLDFNRLTCDFVGTNEYGLLEHASFNHNGYLLTRYFRGQAPKRFKINHMHPSLRDRNHLLPIGYMQDTKRNALAAIRNIYQLNGMRVLYIGDEGYITNEWNYETLDYRIPQCAIYDQIKEIDNPINWTNVAVNPVAKSLQNSITRVSDSALVYKINGNVVDIELPHLYETLRIMRGREVVEATHVDKAGQCRIEKSAFDNLKRESGEWGFEGRQITVNSSNRDPSTLSNPYCHEKSQVEHLERLMRFRGQKKLSFEMRNSPYLPAGAKVLIEYPDEGGYNSTRHSWRTFYISKIERNYSVGCRMKVEGYLGSPTAIWVDENLFASFNASWSWYSNQHTQGYKLKWDCRSRDEFELLGFARHTSYRIYRCRYGVKKYLGEVPHPTNYIIDPMSQVTSASVNLYYIIEIVDKSTKKVIATISVYADSIRISPSNVFVPITPDTRPTIPDTNPTIPDTKPTIPDTHPTVPDTHPTVPDKNKDPVVHYTTMGQWGNVLNRSLTLG